MADRDAKPSTKAKGNILEDLVAQLHEIPSVRVETRKRLPSVRPDSTRVREIDVLLTSDVAGYPFRMAFSCKNEAEKVGTDAADEFLSSLDDVGIPRLQGVFVCPTGYTSDALRLLQENGVRPLLFEGLNTQRLAAEVLEAMQALVCMVGEWRTIQFFEPIGVEGRAPAGMVASDLVVLGDLPAASERAAPFILDHAWHMWMAEHIPQEAGEHLLFIRLPQRKAGKDELRALFFVTLRVFALVGKFTGTATSTSLKHASTDVVEKVRITTQIPRPAVPLTLLKIDTEEEVRAHLAGSKGVRIMHRVRVPRLLSGACYWPPSAEALAKALELRKAGKPVSFANVEGPNLAKAWEFLGDKQPARQDPPDNAAT